MDGDQLRRRRQRHSQGAPDASSPAEQTNLVTQKSGYGNQEAMSMSSISRQQPYAPTAHNAPLNNNISLPQNIIPEQQYQPYIAPPSGSPVQQHQPHDYQQSPPLAQLYPAQTGGLQFGPSVRVEPRTTNPAAGQPQTYFNSLQQSQATQSQAPRYSLYGSLPYDVSDTGGYNISNALARFQRECAAGTRDLPSQRQGLHGGFAGDGFNQSQSSRPAAPRSYQSGQSEACDWLIDCSQQFEPHSRLPGDFMPGSVPSSSVADPLRLAGVWQPDRSSMPPSSQRSTVHTNDDDPLGLFPTFRQAGISLPRPLVGDAVTIGPAPAYSTEQTDISEGDGGVSPPATSRDDNGGAGGASTPPATDEIRPLRLKKAQIPDPGALAYQFSGKLKTKEDAEAAVKSRLRKLSIVNDDWEEVKNNIAEYSKALFKCLIKDFKTTLPGDNKPEILERHKQSQQSAMIELKNLLSTVDGCKSAEEQCTLAICALIAVHEEGMLDRHYDQKNPPKSGGAKIWPDKDSIASKRAQDFFQAVTDDKRIGLDVVKGNFNDVVVNPKAYAKKKYYSLKSNLTRKVNTKKKNGGDDVANTPKMISSTKRRRGAARQSEGSEDKPIPKKKTRHPRKDKAGVDFSSNENAFDSEHNESELNLEQCESEANPEHSERENNLED